MFTSTFIHNKLQYIYILIPQNSLLTFSATLPKDLYSFLQGYSNTMLPCLHLYAPATEWNRYTAYSAEQLANVLWDAVDQWTNQAKAGRKHIIFFSRWGTWAIRNYSKRIKIKTTQNKTSSPQKKPWDIHQSKSTSATLLTYIKSTHFVE